MSVSIQDQSLFIAQTHDRARNLVKSKIWASISEDRLNNWIRQFDHYESSLLGAILLDNLVFRSKAQVSAMLSSLMLSEALRLNAESDFDVVERLAKRIEPGIRIAPAISFSQPPTKSGFYILRLLQRLFRIRPEWLVWPQQISTMPKFAKTLLIVDDFLGSGDQFSEFAKLTKIDELSVKRSDVKIVYLVLAAHGDGIDAVKKDYPAVEILCADVLTRDYHAFEGGRLDERYRTPISDAMKNDYLALAVKAGLPLNGNVGPFGYRNQGLCYAFEHATPNNTLPVFWYDTDNWKPLLDR